MSLQSYNFFYNTRGGFLSSASRKALSLASRLDRAFAPDIEAGNAVSQIEVQDLTSMFVGTDGSGGNPTVGDSVGAIVGSEGFGGKSFEQFAAAQPELLGSDGDGSSVANWAGASGGSIASVGGAFVATTVTGDAAGGGYFAWAEMQAGELYEVEINVTAFTGDGWQLAFDSFSNFHTGVASTLGVHKYAVTADTAAGGIYFYARSNSAGDETATAEYIRVRHIPASLWSAPSDTARPILLDTFSDPNDSALTDNGGRGPELVSADGGDWNKVNSAISFSGSTGTLTPSLAYGSAYISFNAEIGAEYEVIISASGSSGITLVRVGDNTTPSEYTQEIQNPVLYSETIRAVRNNIRLTIAENANDAGNVVTFTASVRKVLSAFDERGPELVSNGGLDDATGWSTSGTIENGYAELDGNTNEFLSQTQDISDGDVFDCTFTLTVVSGSAFVQPTFNGSDAGGTFTSDGTYTVRMTATAARESLYFYTASTGIVRIDDVSLTRVIYPNLVTNGTFDADSDWTKGTGWSISGGVASNDGTAAFGQLSQNVLGGVPPKAWCLGRFYLVSRGSNVSTLRFVVGGAEVYLIDVSAGSGWYEVYFRRHLTSGSVSIQAGSGTGGANDAFSVDNVIVQEVPASISRRYFLRFDGIDDQLTLTDTFGSDMTVVMGMKTSDNIGILLNTNNSGRYAGVVRSSGEAASNNVGTPSFRVDGAAVSVSASSDLANAGISDGSDHVPAITDMDLSGASDLVLGYYGSSSTYNYAFDLSYLAIFPSDADTLALNEQLAAEVSGVTLP